MSDGNQPNLLYYGDNLDILRRYVKDETIVETPVVADKPRKRKGK
jgi:hypothetical protein